MYGKIGKEIGEILSMVCKIAGIELIKGGVCYRYERQAARACPVAICLYYIMNGNKNRSFAIT